MKGWQFCLLMAGIYAAPHTTFEAAIYGVVVYVALSAIFIVAGK